MATAVTVIIRDSTVVVGQTTQATARVTIDESDGLVDARPITWSSGAAAIASVNSSGLITALAAGAAPVRATVDGVTGQATLTVQALPFVAISAADMDKLATWPVGTKFNLKDPNGRVALCQVNG